MLVNPHSRIKPLLCVALLGLSGFSNAVPVQLVNPSVKHVHHTAKVIQCGAFRTELAAYTHMKMLNRKGVNGVTVAQDRNFYIVLAKPQTKAMASELAVIKQWVPDAFLRRWGSNLNQANIVGY